MCLRCYQSSSTMTARAAGAKYRAAQACTDHSSTDCIDMHKSRQHSHAEHGDLKCRQNALQPMNTCKERPRSP
jgi:hypothetical protein